MLGCEVLFDEQQGREVMELVERTTGKPCPCKQGQGCPLLGVRPLVYESQRAAS